jgi:hypothetical protein
MKIKSERIVRMLRKNLFLPYSFKVKFFQHIDDNGEYCVLIQHFFNSDDVFTPAQCSNMIIEHFNILLGFYNYKLPLPRVYIQMYMKKSNDF